MVEYASSFQASMQEDHASIGDTIESKACNIDAEIKT